MWCSHVRFLEQPKPWEAIGWAFFFLIMSVSARKHCLKQNDDDNIASDVLLLW
uniref:Uncharacterized protein n=1 Tax=Oryza brachyantha TaxID=4533 RepID=J3L318_ORYBR